MNIATTVKTISDVLINGEQPSEKTKICAYELFKIYAQTFDRDLLYVIGKLLPDGKHKTRIKQGNEYIEVRIHKNNHTIKSKVHRLVPVKN